MERSKSRAALDAWLIQAERVLQTGKELDTGQAWEEESVEHGDAA